MEGEREKREKVVESTPLGWPLGWRAKKRCTTDPRRQITRRQTWRAPRSWLRTTDLKLSGQVRSMSRSRALVRHDICFLFRRTYAPRRIYMSHWNRTVEGAISFLLVSPGFFSRSRMRGFGTGSRIWSRLKGTHTHRILI